MRDKKSSIKYAPLVCSLIATAFVLLRAPLIIVSSDASFHFSLITVNTMFGGFLYTNYSLLIGVLDNEVVKKVRNTDIIRKRNAHILQGIKYAAISVSAGLYVVLVGEHEVPSMDVIYILALNIEIIYMVFLIVYFMLSLKEMSTLVNSLSHPLDERTEGEIDGLRLKIKSFCKKDENN